MVNNDNYTKGYENLKAFIESKCSEIEALFAEGDFVQGVAVLKEAADAEQAMGAFKALKGLVDWWANQRKLAETSTPTELTT